MNKKFVWIGNDVYIPYDNIELLTDYIQPATKKLVKQAKIDGRLMDYSRGQGKEAVVLTRNGTVIITSIELFQVLEDMKEHG